MFSLALRAALLDGSVFDEIRDRPESMFSALGIVLIAGVAFGLGVWQVLQDPARPGFDYDQNLSLIVAVSSVFTGWFVWSVFAWLLAGRLFGGSAGYRATVRAIGICYAPLILWILIGVPAIFLIALNLGRLWVLVTATVSIKRTHDLSWWKAVISTAVGWFWAVVVIPTMFVFPSTPGA